MKKMMVVLLAVVLLCAQACALESAGYPAYDGAELRANSCAGTFGTDSLILDFDPSAEFSMCEDGYLQACFYAMNAAGDSYIEIYLLIPENTQSGDVIDPACADRTGLSDCCVSFYEVVDQTEIFYIAIQEGAMPYPENSSYEIRVDSFLDTGAAYCMRGTVSGVLAEVDELTPTGRTLDVNAAFDFSLPKTGGLQASPAPDLFAAPSVPDSTDGAQGFAAAPAFTLPPDYAKI